jgi:putative ABC transport system permease protein
MMGLLTGILVAMAVTLVLSVVLIGLIFSMAANERRRELGVLRAMGATRNFVFKSLLTEAGLLALVGGAAGIALTVLAIFLFHRLITVSLGIPFLLPSPVALLPQIAGGLVLALLAATAAAMLPAYRISHLDPAVAMRE